MRFPAQRQHCPGYWFVFAKTVMAASAEEAALAQLLFGTSAARPSRPAQRSSEIDSDDEDSSQHRGADDAAASDDGGGDEDDDEDEDDGDDDDNDDGDDDDDRAGGGEGDAVRSSGKVSATRAQPQPKRKPAWNDDDDAKVEIDISDGAARLRKLRRDESEATVSGAEFERRLRAQFTKLAPAADWAKPTIGSGGGGGGAAVNTDFLRDAASLVGGAGRIPRGTLKVRRVTDANIAEPSQAVVQSVQWHPNASVVMTAGLDKKVRLFQLDGKVNRKIQAFHLDDLPVRTAAISADGQQIICAGRRSFFYSIDLLTAKVVRVPRLHGCKEKSLETFVLSPDGKLICFLGNDGYLIVVLAATHRLICTLKMNGTVRAAAFTPDSRELLSIGGDGEVYRWDLRQQRCLQRFQDEGNLGGTSIAVAPTGGLFAVGSTSGVVNVYDAATTLGGMTMATAEEAPRPKKVWVCAWMHALRVCVRVCAWYVCSAECRG